MGKKDLVFLSWLLLVSLGVTSALRCSSTGFFRPNSTYGRNRELLLSYLASNVTAEGGFYNASVGQESDRVNALALCREGYEKDACFNCIQQATADLLEKCPNQTDAFQWGGEVPCLVRYSNRSIFGSLVLGPDDTVYNTGDVTSNLTQFDEIWERLMLQTIAAAAKGTSSSRLKYYAVAREALTYFQDIYTLMQCTPDISSDDCNNCLIESVGYYQSCCHGKQGGVVARPSCFFRWDLYPFYGAFDNIQSPTPPQPQPSPGDQTKEATTKESGSISSGIIVAIVIPTIIAILVLIVLGYALCRRRKTYQAVEMATETNGPRSLRFDLGTVRSATNDFSIENKLGQGGFGAVYKGKLANGQKIAVKRLSIDSGQGDLEFKNEVSLLVGLQHRNLVKLLGFCLERNEKLLIYEFVLNSSLDKLIFDSAKRSLLTWEARYKIIGGIARGLLYLHEDSRLRIIHRDLKASNILLDPEMNAKISDFGMARLFAADETHGETSKIMGTYGYMAPEYIQHGKFSVKSDVYSFGILVLEIIIGLKNTSFQAEGLPAYAWKSWSEGRGQDIIDPIIRNGSKSEIMRCIHIGLLCVQANVARRPTMNSVLLWFSSSSVSLPVPASPAFLAYGTSKLETSSSHQYTSNASDQPKGEASLNGVSITDLDPR